MGGGALDTESGYGMNLIRTNIALGSVSLLLLFVFGACSHAPAPSVQAEAGTSGATLENADLEDQILKPRPRSEYWWNFMREEIPLIRGGRFQDRRDSLGFDEYRALVEEDQRDRGFTKQRPDRARVGIPNHPVEKRQRE